MGLLRKIALVPDGVKVDSSELTRVASALSKQVQRDFSPIWEVNAVVDAYTRLEDVDVDYWPIIIQKDVKGAAGYHDDKDGQPFALVEFGREWSLTASHECLEMLADPFGRRLQASRLPDQAVELGLTQDRVRYLVEVCDPSESSDFAYHVNDVLVSDFYTPNYFDPVTSSAVRYSFTGAITSPRQVLDGGYLSWQDITSGHWIQLRMFRDEFSDKSPHVLDLSEKTQIAKLLETQSIRSAIDRLTKTPESSRKSSGSALMAARGREGKADASRAARAESLRKTITRVVQASSDSE